MAFRDVRVSERHFYYDAGKYPMLRFCTASIPSIYFLQLLKNTFYVF